MKPGKRQEAGCGGSPWQEWRRTVTPVRVLDAGRVTRGSSLLPERRVEPGHGDPWGAAPLYPEHRQEHLHPGAAHLDRARPAEPVGPAKPAVSAAVDPGPETPAAGAAEDTPVRRVETAVRQRMLCSLETLVRSLDWRERKSPDHSSRIAATALLIAQRMGLARAEQQSLVLGCLLHDIGMTGLPAPAHDKPGPLTREEWEALRTHPRTGFGLVRDSLCLDAGSEVVLHHHEQWDGNGYPEGLKGSRIPLLARIAALADTLESLTGGSVYRRSQPLFRAMIEIRRSSGSQLDPEVVRAFLSVDPVTWERVRLRGRGEHWTILGIQPSSTDARLLDRWVA